LQDKILLSDKKPPFNGPYFFSASIQNSLHVG
jgi:hypothetical protein